MSAAVTTGIMGSDFYASSKATDILPFISHKVIHDIGLDARDIACWPSGIEENYIGTTGLEVGRTL